MLYYAIDPHEAQRIYQAGFRQGQQVAFDPDTRLQSLFPGLKPNTVELASIAAETRSCGFSFVSFPRRAWEREVKAFAVFDFFDTSLSLNATWFIDNVERNSFRFFAI